MPTRHHPVSRSITLVVAGLVLCLIQPHPRNSAGADEPIPWVEALLDVPYAATEDAPVAPRPALRLVRQDFEQLELRRSVIRTPMVIGGKPFARGLGTHSIGHIQILSPEPMVRFSAVIGLDENERTSPGRGSIDFTVTADGREEYRSGVFHGGDPAEVLDIPLKPSTVLDLQVGDAGDGPAFDHADWAEAKIVTADGKSFWLDELGSWSPGGPSRYPFSFTYAGQTADRCLPAWKHQAASQELDADRTQIVRTWTDPATGLLLEWRIIRYADFPAVEWLLYLENTSAKDTPIIESLLALNLMLPSQPDEDDAYRLHSSNGAPSNPTDFEPRVVDLERGGFQVLGAGGGRSSNKDFPFFKIESPQSSLIAAVGWSGQWRAGIDCRADGRPHLTAGLEKTRFLLHPGERVRSPRILLLNWPGDTLESNAQFRQLIYKHYVARRDGRRPLPTLYCNTCFTRGGGWLNECNAENQISLIRAYQPLRLEALVTDAGWFEGGWPAGAGNWTPRKDAYPDGMRPVAAAAKQHGTTYGLWFEFERVMADTWLHKNHPEWLLKRIDGPETMYLLNLALPEVRAYLLDIVKGFMDLPGFSTYRQDFNMDPLPYWRHTDSPDRQGIAEMHYIAGLYEYWEEIARVCPQGLRIECASGGRRIDLETVMRMHVHQKSDYWFDNEVDQGSIWSLSQYLPNNVFMAPINRLDERSFHSAMATSLCLGWIADAPEFDLRRAQELVDAYHGVGPLLVGGWYPLLPYCRDGSQWNASQYHRPDLGQGMILVFPPLEGAHESIGLALHGLDPPADYQLTFHLSGREVKATGAQLMNQLVVTIPKDNKAERITYRVAD